MKANERNIYIKNKSQEKNLITCLSEGNSILYKYISYKAQSV